MLSGNVQQTIISVIRSSANVGFLICLDGIWCGVNQRPEAALERTFAVSVCGAGTLAKRGEKMMLKETIMLSKIPWKNIRNDIRLTRYSIGGLGLLILLLAAGETAGGIKLASQCRANLGYRSCYPAGDPCSRMSTPAFMGSAVLFSFLCAITCGSIRTMSGLLMIVIVAEVTLGIYLQFTPQANSYMTNFMLKASDPLLQCEKMQDNKTGFCWYNLAHQFYWCNNVHKITLHTCNQTSGVPSTHCEPGNKCADAKSWPLHDHEVADVSVNEIGQTDQEGMGIYVTAPPLDVAKSANLTEFHFKLHGYEMQMVIAKRRKCFETVTQNAYRHFSVYKNLTVTVLLVSGVLHLACSVVLFLLDRKNLGIKTMVKDKHFHKRPDVVAVPKSKEKESHL